MPKLLFVSMNPFYPETSGGAEYSALYLFEQLVKQGWKVEVICTSSKQLPYLLALVWRVLRSLKISFPVIRDKSFNFVCWRILRSYNAKDDPVNFLNKHLQKYKPDVVLGHSNPECPLLNYSANQGYLAFFLARTTECLENSSKISDRINLLANSPYSASVLSQRTGRKVRVVLPFLELNKYKIKENKRRYITFINTIQVKGAEVALNIAKSLPEKQFLFIKGNWFQKIHRDWQNTFIDRCSRTPNIQVWDHQEDMRKVYSVTDVLLVPSQFNETFGRVILEAQLNGIPVIAAQVGGISYTLGDGGILINPKDNVEAYIEAIQKLHSDELCYQEFSSLAVKNSQRPEFNPQYQINQLINFFKLMPSVNESSLKEDID